ncbi:toll/interleukin-1 receptor domain-containing protein [Frankia sp. Cpl3]|nr:toll/interleukin-1 receptor domain-containing protein [Frankia sp. Cpl3]
MTEPEPMGTTAGVTAVERDAFELAASLSIAAFVDLRLVRVFRQELHPGLPASAEAALWFGPLVAQASGDMLLLDEGMLPTLRRHLLDRPPRHRAHAQQARGLLERVRDADGAGRYLRTEEQLIWLGLRGASRRTIDGALHEVFLDLRDRTNPRLGEDIARWAARALPRLPPAVLAYSEAARFLAAFAERQVGQSLGVSPDAAATRLLEHLSADGSRVEVGVRLAGGQLELSCPPVPGAHQLTAPGSDPVVLDLLAPRPLSEPLPWLDSETTASAEFDHRPGVLVIELPATRRTDRIDAVARFLGEHGFAVSRRDAAELDVASLETESSVLALFSDGRPLALWRAAETLEFCATARVPTVVIDASTVGRALESQAGGAAQAATGADTDGSEAAEARAKLLDALALLLAAQRPQAVAAVPRPGFVTVPVEGPVWVRATGEPWHVLSPTLPAGVRPLGPDDPRGIGPFPFLGLIDRTELGPIFLTRVSEGRLAVVKIATSGPARVFADNLRAISRPWATIDSPFVTRLVHAYADHDPPYCVVDFAPGERLDDMVYESETPRNAVWRLRFAYQFARALAAVHAAGLVHGHLSSGAARSHEGRFQLVRMHSAGLIGSRTPGNDAESRPHFRPEARRRVPLEPSADIYGWADLVLRTTAGWQRSRRGQPHPNSGFTELDALVTRASDGKPDRRPSAREIVDRLADAAEEYPDLSSSQAEESTGADAPAWQGQVGWSSILPPALPTEPFVDLREGVEERDVRPAPGGVPSDPPRYTQPSTAATRRQTQGDRVRLSSEDRDLLVSELSMIFIMPASVDNLLRRIGIPRRQTPSWSSTSSFQLWSSIIDDMEAGIVQEPYERLLTAASSDYPANAVLRDLVDRYVGTSARKRPTHPPTYPGHDRFFISYAQSDIDRARSLYGQLRRDGFSPWLDDIDLADAPEGQDTQTATENALRGSRVVIILLSRNSTDSWSRILTETLYPMMESRDKFIIPTRLEPCEIPDSLRSIAGVDLFTDDGYRHLTSSLRRYVGRPAFPGDTR